MNEKIAVIGGAGFIGKNLCSKLSREGLEFSVFDKKIDPSSGYDHFFLDIEDSETLNKLEGYTVIIHLAAEHRDDVKPKSKYFDINVKGTENLLKAANKFEIKKILFLSTVAVYGFSNKELNENSKINYFNEYGKTKFLAENSLREWFKKNKNDKKLTIIRPTVVFGEGNKGNVHNLINQIHRKKFFMIGNGKNKKSMAYVDNLSAFIIYNLRFEKGYYLYNYSDSPDMDMNELVIFIKKQFKMSPKILLRIPKFFGILAGYFFDILSLILGKNLPVSSIRIIKFLNSSIFSSKKIEGFIPPYTLEEALSKTIENDFINKNNTL